MESNGDPEFRLVIRLEPGDPVAQWAARELLRLTAAGYGINVGGGGDSGALAGAVAETLGEFDNERELLTGMGTSRPVRGHDRRPDAASGCARG
jgi:hypothetical protein